MKKHKITIGKGIAKRYMDEMLAQATISGRCNPNTKAFTDLCAEIKRELAGKVKRK